MFHTALCGKIGHAVYVAEPYDIFDVDIVANQVFLVVVYVNHSHESFTVLPVKVEEAAVLPVLVDIVWIVGRCVIVSKKQYQAFFHLTLQPFSSG